MPATAVEPEATQRWRAEFRATWDAFNREQPVLIVTHHDADGLTAGTIVAQACARLQRPAEVRILGRGENPWSEPVQIELRERSCGGLIVADLGTRPGVIRPGTPTILIDHHVPTGFPPETAVISGYGHEPVPTSALLAHWCVAELCLVNDLLWLVAISLIGDLAEKSGFAEWEQARERYGVGVLREATALLNAARRAGSGCAQPAFDLLMKAHEPEQILSGAFPETEQLLRAREEVNAALEKAKRVAPKVVGEIALIRLHTPCQVHPLVAQLWRARLKKNIVLVANTGYREGWVHFAARSATGRNLIEFLRERAPADADENYGSGHEQATGGALRIPAWNEFVRGLGFGPEMEVRS